MSNELLAQALRDVQEMWDMLSKVGTAPALMRKFSRSISEIEAALAAHEALAAVPVEPCLPNWPTYDAAIADPLFQQVRGIMGTENWGQEEALRRAIMHAIYPHPSTQPRPTDLAATVEDKAVYASIAANYHVDAHPAPQPQHALQTRLDDYATEINRLRNVIQAACIGGTDYMIERWKQLFPDAPVPTVKPQQAERDCPHCNYSGTVHCGDVAAQIQANGGEPRNCSNAHAYGLRVATPPQPTAPAPQAQAVSQWQGIESAPRDGASILLLIEGGELPLQDDSLSVSIGAYGVHGGPNEDPTWDFAGWSWHQDCYCRGDGKPVGWMPIPEAPASAAPAPQAQAVNDELDLIEAVLKGYPVSIANSDARRAVRAVRAAVVTASAAQKEPT